MNAADFLAATTRLPIGTLRDIVGDGGLVVVAPHPDDETLGCGGLIAAACAAAVPVRLVVISDGVGSHPNSKRYPPVRLRALREAETLAATAELGLDPAAIRFLRLPDREVPTTGMAAEMASEAIVAAASEVVAKAICVTWRHDPHCDHAASAFIVDAAKRRCRDTRIWSYPIWAWNLPSDRDVGESPVGFRFDVALYVEAKTAAIAAHRSQTTSLIDDDTRGFRLMPEMLARFTSRYEIYLASEFAEERS